MAQAEYDPAVAAAMGEPFAGDDEVQRGQMMGHPVLFYAPRGGKRKMFACAYGPGVALKLPEGQIAELLEDPQFAPFAPGGGPMRGWVVMAWRDPDAAAELIRAALDYVASRL